MTRRLMPSRVASFRKEIYDYYGLHGRCDLPWRKTSDPYEILVSEVMLQQTQVARVEEKYGPFLRRFPMPASLAHASLREVLSAWSGLGYNRRALALKRAAERIVAEHGGTIPRSHERLVELPGIGHATASAIRVFAFDLPSVFIETNIRSVYLHFFFRGRENISDREILPLVEQTLDTRSPRRFYSALMDYGAMLKTRDNPSRRSLHHKKQARFSGSARQARGAIVCALTEKTLSFEEAVQAGKRTRKETEIMLAQLTKEGFLMKKGKRFSLT